MPAFSRVATEIFLSGLCNGFGKICKIKIIDSDVGDGVRIF